MTSQPGDILGPSVLLVQALRPEWDTRAIRPVLATLIAEGRDLADLIHAAIRTAQDPTMRRPAAIALDTDHWRPTVRHSETPDERAGRIAQQRADREDTYRSRSLIPQRQAMSEPYRKQTRAAISAARHTQPEQQHDQEQEQQAS